MKDSQKNINKKTAIARRLFKKNAKVTVEQIQTSIKAEGFKYGLSPETIKEIKTSVLGLKEKKEGLAKATGPGLTPPPEPQFVAPPADEPTTDNQALNTEGLTETDPVQEASPKMGTVRSAIDRSVGSMTALHGKVNQLNEKLDSLATENVAKAFVEGVQPLVEVVAAVTKTVSGQDGTLQLVAKALGELKTETQKNSKALGNITGSLYKLNTLVTNLDKKLGTNTSGTPGPVNLSDLRRDLEQIKKTMAEIQAIVGTPIVLAELDTTKT